MTAPLLARATDPPDGAAAGRPERDDESERVAALRAYRVLDQPRQDDLDAAVRLAAYVCGTPRAAINLVDADRVWQAAAHGVERAQLPRADAMCSQVVAGAASVSGPVGGVGLHASAPLVTRAGHCIGTVCVSADTPGELSAVQLGLLEDVAGQVMASFEMRRMTAALARISSRDELTGLANRRAMELAIANAIARAERGLGTPSVVVVDLDGFAALNESLGNGIGDAVLRSVADRLTRIARTVDTVARTGGDQFVVLLESTGGPGAAAALGRLRHGLVGGWGDILGGPGEVGAALGITTYRPGDGVASLIARADAEMFADKARHAPGLG